MYRLHTILLFFTLPFLSSCCSNEPLCQVGTFTSYEGDGLIVKTCMVEKQEGHKVQAGPMLVYNSVSGKLVNRMFFADGELHGVFQHWGDSGILKAQGMYSEGKKHGAWLYWDDEGNPVKKEKYNNGALISTEEFTETGSE